MYTNENHSKNKTSVQHSINSERADKVPNCLHYYSLIFQVLTTKNEKKYTVICVISVNLEEYWTMLNESEQMYFTLMVSPLNFCIIHCDYDTKKRFITWFYFMNANEAYIFHVCPKIYYTQCFVWKKLTILSALYGAKWMIMNRFLAHLGAKHPKVSLWDRPVSVCLSVCVSVCVWRA